MIINKFKKGFTLIELLVVIGILAVIAAGIVALINPADKLAQANDVTAQQKASEVATSAQAYAAQMGYYPLSVSDASFVGVGKELGAVPTQPTGYTYTLTPGQAGATACNNTTILCNSMVVKVGPMKSNKFVVGNYWLFDSKTGKTCTGASTLTGCP